MKRFALFSSILFCLFIAIIVGLGGLHLSYFVRYVPTVVFRPPTLESPFVPAIFPDREPADHWALIPGVFYVHREPDAETHLLVGIGDFESYGYRNAQSFTIERLEVVGSGGESLLLVPPEHPLTFQIDAADRGRKRASLGRCSGEKFTVQVQGHAIMRSGTKATFSESQVWTKTFSTTLKFGISLRE